MQVWKKVQISCWQGEKVSSAEDTVTSFRQEEAGDSSTMMRRQHLVLGGYMLFDSTEGQSLVQPSSSTVPVSEELKDPGSHMTEAAASSWF